MKNKVCLLVLAVVALLMLAACGQSGSSASQTMPGETIEAASLPSGVEKRGGKWIVPHGPSGKFHMLSIDEWYWVTSILIAKGADFTIENIDRVIDDVLGLPCFNIGGARVNCD